MASPFSPPAAEFPRFLLRRLSALDYPSSHLSSLSFSSDFSVSHVFLWLESTKIRQLPVENRPALVERGNINQWKEIVTQYFQELNCPHPIEFSSFSPSSPPHLSLSLLCWLVDLAASEEFAENSAEFNAKSQQEKFQLLQNPSSSPSILSDSSLSSPGVKENSSAPALWENSPVEQLLPIAWKLLRQLLPESSFTGDAGKILPGNSSNPSSGNLSDLLALLKIVNLAITMAEGFQLNSIEGPAKPLPAPGILPSSEWTALSSPSHDRLVDSAGSSFPSSPVVAPAVAVAAVSDLGFSTGHPGLDHISRVFRLLFTFDLQVLQQEINSALQAAQNAIKAEPKTM